MTEQTLSGRRNRNNATRLALIEAHDRGLARRHLLKLTRLADRPCRCGEVHRHACSYPDVVRALDST